MLISRWCGTLGLSHLLMALALCCTGGRRVLVVARGSNKARLVGAPPGGTSRSHEGHPGVSFTPRITSLPLIKDLRLDNFYGALTTRNAHVLCQERTGQACSCRNLRAEKFDVLVAATDAGFGESSRPGRQSVNWLRTVSALCVQSISASLFLILCA